jgi:hypothetical protein
LNPLNIFFLSNVFLKFLNDLVFHQIHPMNMYFDRKGQIFFVQNFLNQLYDFIPSFW